jgi:hypothetical protein
MGVMAGIPLPHQPTDPFREELIALLLEPSYFFSGKFLLYPIYFCAYGTDILYRGAV